MLTPFRGSFLHRRQLMRAITRLSLGIAIAVAVYASSALGTAFAVPALPPVDIDRPPVITGPDVSVTFTAEGAGFTFECKLDDGAFAACDSPHDLIDLDG